MKGKIKGLAVLVVIALSCLCLNLSNIHAQENTENCPMPPLDVLGEDVGGLLRYPNSVRTRFSKNTKKTLMQLSQTAVGVEVSYQCAGTMKEILDFYNQQIKENGWELFSSGYMGATTLNMVIGKADNKILFTLRPHRAMFAPPSGQADEPAIKTCYTVQLFYWNAADAKPLERKNSSRRNSRQSSGRR